MITIKEKELGMTDLEAAREIDRQAEQRDARNADKSLTALFCLMGIHSVCLVVVGCTRAARRKSSKGTEQQSEERKSFIDYFAIVMLAVTFLLSLVIAYRETKAKKRFQVRRERALMRGDDYKKGYGPVACKGCSKTVRKIDDMHSLLWQLRYVLPIDDSKESGIRLYKYLDGDNTAGSGESHL